MFVRFNEKFLPIKTSIVSALLTFTVPIVLWLLFGDRDIQGQWEAIFEWHLGTIITTLIPLCFFVGWRSYAYAIIYLKDRKMIWRPLLEGFSAGFAIVTIPLWLAAVKTALAAGTIYDNAAVWTLSEWVNFFVYTTVFGAISGTVFAAWMGLLSILMCCQIKRTR
jgi:Na+-translocating ferredoxin:NAD+ oxidoreductase RnfE subunit